MCTTGHHATTSKTPTFLECKRSNENVIVHTLVGTAATAIAHPIGHFIRGNRISKWAQRRLNYKRHWICVSELRPPRVLGQKSLYRCTVMAAQHYGSIGETHFMTMKRAVQEVVERTSQHLAQGETQQRAIVRKSQVLGHQAPAVITERHSGPIKHRRLPFFHDITRPWRKVDDI